jgi:site-specific DNA-methyltransferase (adenine-specific)
MWVYGSGFPKSHNIGKAVDKIEGNEREVVGDIVYADGSKSRKTSQSFQAGGNGDILGETIKTKGQSDYEGWGTALKPANEPICVAISP